MLKTAPTVSKERIEGWIFDYAKDMAELYHLSDEELAVILEKVIRKLD